MDPECLEGRGAATYGILVTATSYETGACNWLHSVFPGHICRLCCAESQATPPVSAVRRIADTDGNLGLSLRCSTCVLRLLCKTSYISEVIERMWDYRRTRAPARSWHILQYRSRSSHTLNPLTDHAIFSSQDMLLAYEATRLSRRQEL